MSSCIHCRANSVPLSRCGGCMALVYCSESCQRADWDAHHALECVGVKRSREEFEDGFTRLSDQEYLILQNPNRIRAVARSFDLHDLKRVLKHNEDDFMSLLNRSNLFWFYVVANPPKDVYDARIRYRDVFVKRINQV